MLQDAQNNLKTVQDAEKKEKAKAKGKAKAKVKGKCKAKAEAKAKGRAAVVDNQEGCIEDAEEDALSAQERGGAEEKVEQPVPKGKAKAKSSSKKAAAPQEN